MHTIKIPLFIATKFGPEENVRIIAIFLSHGAE
jgi:hypothetical protein